MYIGKERVTRFRDQQESRLAQNLVEDFQRGEKPNPFDDRPIPIVRGRENQSNRFFQQELSIARTTGMDEQLVSADDSFVGATVSLPQLQLFNKPTDVVSSNSANPEVTQEPVHAPRDVQTKAAVPVESKPRTEVPDRRAITSQPAPVAQTQPVPVAQAQALRSVSDVKREVFRWSGFAAGAAIGGVAATLLLIVLSAAT